VLCGRAADASQLQEQVATRDQVLDAIAAFVLGDEMVQQRFGQRSAVRGAVNVLGVETRHAGIEGLKRLHQLNATLRLAQEIFEPVLLGAEQGQG